MQQQQQPRRPRPFYVPPYRRYDAGPDNEFTHSRPPLGQSRGGHSRGRGRDGVFGGYRGRGGFSGRRDVPYSQNPTQERTNDPFDELEVVEESNGAINFGAYEDIPVEATGTDISAPVNTFAEIDLGEAINQNIKRCNYTRPTPIQRHAIPVAVGGRDLMACAQTGSGKTAAYCLPIIHGVLKSKAHVKRTATRVACPLALVLSPTRELSCQIHDEAKKFAHQTGVKVGVAYGGAPFGSQVRILERGVDVLVATPGRLADMVERQKVSLKMIKYLAIDEADRMLDMGFEPQIRRIVDEMDMPPSNARQTMLFSATFPDDIQMLAADFLTNYVFLAVGRIGSSTDLITQKVEFVEDMDKKGYLMDLLCNLQQNGSSGKRDLTLIFVETKRGADILESWLSDNGFPAIAIHGDKVQFERERALKSFKTGATPIMVATDVASRGLDIPHVAHVVNFDLPKSIDDYVHRIGRTGRAGKSGTATAFFNNKNMSLAKALADLIKEGKQEVPSWLIEFAEQSFDGSFSKQHSRGGSKFGGRDFRRGGGGGGPRNKSYSSDGFEYSNPSTAAADDLINGVAAVDYSESYNNHGSLDRKDALLGYAAVEPCGWE